MRRLLTVAAVAVVTLAAMGGVVFGLQDRRTFVPAPESVASSLLKQLATHRYGQTRQYLAESARLEYTPDRLRAWTRELETRTGRLRTVHGDGAEMGDGTARATVRVEGSDAKASLQIELRRERGVWAVARLPPPY